MLRLDPAAVGFNSRVFTRMTGVPDKELSDLLDFSAMFYPPVPSAADPCKGSNGLDVNNFHGFKSGAAMEASNPHWNSPVQLTNSCYDAKGFEGPGSYHPSASGDVLNTFSASAADQPDSAGNPEDLVYSRTYQSRNNVKVALSGNMTISTSSVSRSPYFSNSGKRPATDDIQSNHGGETFLPDPKRMKSSSTYSQGSEDFGHEQQNFEQIHYQPPSKIPPSLGLFGGEYQTYAESRAVSGPWLVNGDPMTPSNYLSPVPPNFGPLAQVGSYSMALRNNLNYSAVGSPSAGLSMLAAFHDTAPSGSGSVGAYSSSTSSSLPHEHGPGTQISFQTGDALGKALASIYASDQLNNSFTSASSSPVSSPPPVTGMSSHWASSGRNSSSPIAKKPTIHPMQHGRMEERLDDAIHVLRNHAESNSLMPSLIAPGLIVPKGMVPPLPALPPPPLPPPLPPPPPSHSMDMAGYDSCYMSPMVIPAHLHTNHPCQPSLLPTVDRNRTSQVSAESGRSLQLDKVGSEDNENAKDNSGEKFDFHVNSTDGSTRDSSTKGLASPSLSSASASASTKGHYMKRHRRLGSLANDCNDVDDMFDDDEDDDASPETKAQREKVRRQQNNARERLRVKDINEAIKELGQMISIHTGCRQPMTRLMIVQEAVNVITNLEMKLKERNLNPKAACLKRREEEKADELPGRSAMLPPHPSITPNTGDRKSVV